MTEAFKAGDLENAAAGMPQLSDDYHQIIRAVEAYKTCREG
jgi:hypothetical protein